MAKNLLSDTTIRNTKPADKAQRLNDGGGLYLLIQPNGSKWWRMDYSISAKRKTISLGTYPETSLTLARKKAAAASEQVAEGIDPSETRKAAKEADRKKAEADKLVEGGMPHPDSYEAICRAWIKSKGEAQFSSYLARQVNDVFPWIGRKLMADIQPRDIVAVLDKMDARGIRHSVRKTQSEISQCFKWAIQQAARGNGAVITINPCTNLVGMYKRESTEHFASITDPVKVGELLRSIDAYSSGTPAVRAALRLGPMLFCRPGELRSMRWADLDLDAAQWAFVVTKTKTNHLVPLSTQAVAILRELHPLTRHSEYVFPNNRGASRCMSGMAVNRALQTMGYDTKTQITGHGFRAMARTMLAERLEQPPEWIEHQLAHRVPDTLGNAYNRTKYIKQRTEMMQLWADYLDKLKEGAEVVRLFG